VKELVVPVPETVTAAYVVPVPAPMSTVEARRQRDRPRGRRRRDGAFAPGPPASDPGLSAIVDPLTSRELEVLEMLATGRSNQAIARELVVTLDPVKKHVSHVLGKLGAANRTEAVTRARELSLISRHRARLS